VIDLEPSDRFATEAAGGWLLLGNSDEALRELNEIPEARRFHPDVLLVEWEIHASRRDWEASIATAEMLVQRAPERPDGVVKKAFALHELKRTREAWNCLYPASEKFQDQWIIPYNLACYACQLGDKEAALEQLRTAMNRADAKELRSMALKDPDLEPLAREIQRL
jgi:tetratricopeptide (TPR) repeat protein